MATIPVPAPVAQAPVNHVGRIIGMFFSPKSVFEDIVRKHISNDTLSVEQIADEMSVSRSQLFRKVRQFTGLLPNHFILEIRFNYARQLLEQGKVSSVKAVAAEIGFRKPAYFSELFKARFGKHPSDFLN